MMGGQCSFVLVVELFGVDFDCYFVVFGCQEYLFGLFGVEGDGFVEYIYCFGQVFGGDGGNYCFVYFVDVGLCGVFWWNGVGVEEGWYDFDCVLLFQGVGYVQLFVFVGEGEVVVGFDFQCGDVFGEYCVQLGQICGDECVVGGGVGGVYGGYDVVVGVCDVGVVYVLQMLFEFVGVVVGVDQVGMVVDQFWVDLVVVVVDVLGWLQVCF